MVPIEITYAINTNLHPMSHRFEVITDYWSNLRFRQGVLLCDTLVRGEPLTQDLEIWPQETRKIALSYGVNIIYIRVFRFVRVHAFDRQTDVDSNRPL